VQNYVIYRTKYLTCNHHAYNHTGYFNFQSLLIYIIIKTSNSIKPSLTIFLFVTLIFRTEIFISLSGLEFSTCTFDSQSDLVRYCCCISFYNPHRSCCYIFNDSLNWEEILRGARKNICRREVYPGNGYPSKYSSTHDTLNPFLPFLKRSSKDTREHDLYKRQVSSRRIGPAMCHESPRETRRANISRVRNRLSRRVTYFSAFSPSLGGEESVFNFAQGYHWRSRADKTARGTSTRRPASEYVRLRAGRSRLYRRQFRNIISEILACRGCVPRKKEVIGLSG